MGVLSSLINAASQELTNHHNRNAVDATNTSNEAIAKSTNEANMAMNRENIAFQRETNDLNYQRQLAENNLAREREDNAVQRAAKDMEAAGLSKTLAAGSPASSANLTASQAQAPEHKFQMQRWERKAFKADAIKVDADILESLQKVKNIERTGLQNDFQNWYNNFVTTNGFLPGSATKLQTALGLGTVLQNALGLNLGFDSGTFSLPSLSFGFNPGSSTGSVSSSVDSPVVAPKSSWTPVFYQDDVSSLPLEKETKQALSRSSGEIPTFSATKGYYTAPAPSKKSVSFNETRSGMRPLPALVTDSVDSSNKHTKMSYTDLPLPKKVTTGLPNLLPALGLLGFGFSRISTGGSRARYKFKD